MLLFSSLLRKWWNIWKGFYLRLLLNSGSTGRKISWPFSQTHNPSRITSPPFHSLSSAVILWTRALGMKRHEMRSLLAMTSNSATRPTPTQLTITHRKGFDDMEALSRKSVLTGQLLHQWQDTWSGLWAGPWKKRKNKEQGVWAAETKDANTASHEQFTWAWPPVQHTHAEGSRRERAGERGGN